MNCDNICMCVVNKQFEILEFVFDSFYIDLQYDEISLTLTAASVCCLRKSTPASRKAPNCYRFCSASTLLTCRDQQNQSIGSAMLMT